ncbi:hypothetical protein F4859DRAFT_508069 [Xylaria cf. heliscus]|nr:hypothetical protein F4859DRAFT_508069 [Xylaria cf. heliscus]
MPSFKVLLSLGSLAAGSAAQSFSSDPSCPSSIAALGAAAPPFPSYIEAILPDPANVLKDPWAYASSLCAVATELPADQLSGFAEYGQSLLSFVATELATYDAIVTKCYATGAEAAAATSYIHAIAEQTAPLCQETSAPSGPSNGTATITSAPTSTGTSISAPANSTTTGTSTVPIALAARPTGVLAGAVGAAGFLAAAALL